MRTQRHLEAWKELLQREDVDIYSPESILLTEKQVHELESELIEKEKFYKDWKPPEKYECLLGKNEIIFRALQGEKSENQQLKENM